ncbi:uncharacterized protein Z518_07728 [Rhinocladiella mackenziei CBS 650.93]|uniref:Uncharacterized protein n=1 Tax=Rhinocladiella mackenziei CBS 650.93 TaxID=1442369 RepID=A0A0D2IEB9_9EURO|nr:uncharacterized protein Z518_07728 [Rhinocladiella mackenziei CBS 650.93]KIX04174.1 hypothetical protein Z518_07728 [Rhinocladiella mackenziei CBS 650.93]
MAVSRTTYLITGANRGIGRGLADLFLSRPNTALIALFRDPEDETSKSLAASAFADNTAVIVLPYEAQNPDSAASALDTAQKSHTWHGPTVDVTPEAINQHIAINTIAPLLSFRACLPLLQVPSPSRSGPAKFIAISSEIGSTTNQPKLSHARSLPYGLSKAALNHTFRKLSTEYPNMVVEMLTPGPVLTDLMRELRGMFDQVVKENPKLLERFQPIDKVCKGLMECIDNASLSFGENGSVTGTSGGFRDWKGDVIPW